MKRIINHWIFLFAITILVACGNEKVAEENTEAKVEGNQVTLDTAQLGQAGITYTQIQKSALSGKIKVNGKIDVPPQNMVSVSVPLGGYLRSTKLLPGMHISKGEVIAIMEDPQYIQLQQDYLMAKAQLQMLQPEYNRQKELNQSKASSDKVFEQSRMALQTAQIQIKALSEKLKLIGIHAESLTEQNITRSVNILAPINGYVSNVLVNIGKYVNPTDVLFELVNPEDIHLALTVFERDMDKIFIGQKLVAYTNNNPAKKYNCEVILVGKDVNAERNITIHCHFESYDKQLVPGTFMNAEIATVTKSAMVLPEDCIVSYESKKFIFIKVSNGTFELKEVKTGINENGLTEILNGDELNVLGKEIVVKGSYTLLMKMKNTAE